MQKSISLKPIAQNSIYEPEINREEILREVLLSECSDNNNGNFPKIIYKPNPQLARVVGSNVVAREEAPWQVSNYLNKNFLDKFSHFTASHCFRLV